MNSYIKDLLNIQLESRKPSPKTNLRIQTLRSYLLQQAQPQEHKVRGCALRNQRICIQEDLKIEQIVTSSVERFNGSFKQRSQFKKHLTQKYKSNEEIEKDTRKAALSYLQNLGQKVKKDLKHANFRKRVQCKSPQEQSSPEYKFVLNQCDKLTEENQSQNEYQDTNDNSCDSLERIGSNMGPLRILKLQSCPLIDLNLPSQKSPPFNFSDCKSMGSQETDSISEHYRRARTFTKSFSRQQQSSSSQSNQISGQSKLNKKTKEENKKIPNKIMKALTQKFSQLVHDYFSEEESLSIEDSSPKQQTSLEKQGYQKEQSPDKLFQTQQQKSFKGIRNNLKSLVNDLEIKDLPIIQFINNVDKDQRPLMVKRKSSNIKPFQIDLKKAQRYE